ncbi:MAG: hypothetical protein WC637_01920 [Victivallales bacterium]
MPIKMSDIEVGREYKAGNNQDRVVLGNAKKGRSKIVYASRSGKPGNSYNFRIVSEKGRFAKACYKIGQKLSAMNLKEIIEDTNASSLIR